MRQRETAAEGAEGRSEDLFRARLENLIDPRGQRVSGDDALQCVRQPEHRDARGRAPVQMPEVTSVALR